MNRRTFMTGVVGAIAGVLVGPRLPVAETVVPIDVNALQAELWAAHIENMRMVINEYWILDPSRICANDIMNPGTGKLLRTSRMKWERLDPMLEKYTCSDERS